MTESSVYAGNKHRFRLQATRRDLEDNAPIILDYDVCAISKRWGFHCRNLLTGVELKAQFAEPLEERSSFSWAQGLCVESSRDDGASRFECLDREGGVVQRTDFRVSHHHRTATFDSGVCVCSDQRDLYGGKGRPPLGAVCFVGEPDVALFADAKREAEGLTRTLILRGPHTYLDFGGVCTALDGATRDDANALLEAWTSGARALPAVWDVHGLALTEDLD